MKQKIQKLEELVTIKDNKLKALEVSNWLNTYILILLVFWYN